MNTLKLANEIIKQNRVSKGIAISWAWRINNEYPDDFKKAAADILEGKNYDFSAGGTTLKEVMRISKTPALEALELLRIFCLDPASGGDIIFSMSVRG